MISDKEFRDKYANLYAIYQNWQAGLYSLYDMFVLIYKAGLKVDDSAKIKELEDKLRSCEEANKSLRKQISEDNRALEKEHDDMFNRPTVLASHLARLGFKGTLTREQPFFNSNVSDKPVGSFQEILKIN